MSINIRIIDKKKVSNISFHNEDQLSNWLNNVREKYVSQGIEVWRIYKLRIVNGNFIV